MDTLSGTAKLMLAVFVENGIRERYCLSIFGLLLKRSQWDEHHQDKFTKAINELHDKGLIEWGEQYVLVLTGTGYNALSQRGG